MMLELWLGELPAARLRRRPRAGAVGRVTRAELRRGHARAQRGENLQRLAAALAAQTHPPREWVVVDDGSTDATPVVLAAAGAPRHAWVRPLDRHGRGRGERSPTGAARARD